MIGSNNHVYNKDSYLILAITGKVMLLCISQDTSQWNTFPLYSGNHWQSGTSTYQSVEHFSALFWEVATAQ